MSGLFPAVQPEAVAPVQTLPLCREVAWDYAKGIPIFSNGRPVEVSGAEAVQVWAWKAIRTARFCHDIYTWDFGCEVNSLIGKGFTSAVKESEAIRYIREALEPNPYITEVRQVTISFSDSTLHILCQIKTIYGEVEVHV